MRQPVAFLLAWALLLPTAVTAAQAVGARARPPATTSCWRVISRAVGRSTRRPTRSGGRWSSQPKSAELHAELAGLYARQNKAVEALDTAEQAIAIDPENREANRLLGSIYTALAEQKRALRAGG